MACNLCLSFYLSLPLSLFVPLFLLPSLIFSFTFDIAGVTTFAFPRVHDVAPVDLHLDLGLARGTGVWTPPHDDTDTALGLMGTKLRPIKSYDARANEPRSASAGTAGQSPMAETSHDVLLLYVTVHRPGQIGLGQPMSRQVVR